MTNLSTALIAGGFTQGVANSTSPEREAERSRARALKAEQDAKLAEIQRQQTPEFTSAKDAADLSQLQLLTEQNKQLIRSSVKSRTFDALDRFSTDADPKHLTNLVQDLKADGLPTGPLGDIARFDKLTANDRELIVRAGLNPDEVLTSPEVMADLIRVTDTAGNVTIRSVDRLKGGLNYTRYANARELEDMRTRAEIFYRMKSRTGSTKDEREAENIMRERYPELTAESSEYVEKYNDVFANIVARNRQTAAGKDEDAVDQVINQIDEMAEKNFNADFFDLDMADPKIRRKFERSIERIERQGKLDLSEGEKKTLSQIKQLRALGGIVGEELSASETGLIDRFANNTEKYLRDKVGGVKATSAYAAYRNILRNALYGSVLTEGEMSAFREQFGDLGQQTGPVLAQLQVALTQLRGQLQSLLDTNNSYVMHFRAGTDKEGLNDIIDGLQERIDFFAREQGTTADVVQRASPGARPALTAEREAALRALDIEVQGEN